MGQRVLTLAKDDPRFEIAAALTEPIDPRLGEPALAEGGAPPLTAELAVACDAYIDFTLPAGTVAGVHACLERKAAMVIGTTGHDAAQLATIEEASRAIPILKATNFSVGVNLLLSIVGSVAKRLGDGFDIEIVEAHHRKKVDAPSGTAVSLLEELLKATGRSQANNVVHGREGNVGARPAKEIGVHAVRMGDVVGEHAVHFGGPGEVITLSHSALSRDCFASGALAAAAWLKGKAPGMYAMRDVLGAAQS